MVKSRLRNPDFFLLAATGAILVFGILILSSASAQFSQLKFHNSFYLLQHQILMGIIPGLILGLIAYIIPIDKIRSLAPLLLLATVVLLVMVFIPGLGVQAGGAQRWVDLGFTSIQPSEILKLTFTLYLASWLSSRLEKNERARDGKKRGFSSTFWAFLIVVGIVGLFLILQPDISTFGIIALTALCMYFVSDTPLRHTFFIICLGVAALLMLVVVEPYRFDRFHAWMSPESDPMGKSFQSNQALIIVGSGGIFGQGFGSSSSKYAILPELIGDSIFAPYAQETGFVGCVMVISLFAFIVWRGFRISQKSEDNFSRLAAVGICFWIAFQSFINMASTARLIPLSGVPLPFMSYGGTAMMVELAAIGLLMNISRHRSYDSD